MTDTILNCSNGLQSFNEFKGAHLTKLYTNYIDCSENYRQVAEESCEDFLSNKERGLPRYAVQRMRMRKLKEKVRLSNKTKAIAVNF